MEFTILFKLLDLFGYLLKSFTNPLFFVPIFLLLIGLMVRYFFRVIGGKYS